MCSNSSPQRHPKVLAIIPCYNEVSAIGNLLEEFRALSFPCDTLVIDDGSDDGTQAVASRFSTVIRFENNQGVPAAIREGIRFARKHDYDFCIQIDGDGQHIPAEIAKCLAVGEEGAINLAIGSRYYQRPYPVAENPRRMAGSIISLAVYILFGQQWLYDPLSGMRLMDRKAMEYFDTHLDISKPDAVMVAQAWSAGLTIREIPVRMRARMSGRSYVSGLKGGRFLLRLIWDMIHIRFTRG